MYKRGRVNKKRTYRKKRSYKGKKRQTLVSKIKSVVNKTAETKFTTNAGYFALSFTRQDRQTLYSSQYVVVTNYPVAGTSYYTRVGDKISNVKLWLTIDIRQYGQPVDTAAAVFPHTCYYVRVIIFSKPSDTSDTGSISNFWDMTDANTHMMPINRDNVRVYYDKVIKGTTPTPITGNTGGAKHMWTAHKMSLNLNIPKDVYFSGIVDTSPKYLTQKRYMAILSFSYNDIDPATAQNFGYVYYQSRLYFKDL